MNKVALQRNRKKPERKMKGQAQEWWDNCCETQHKVPSSVEKNKKIKPKEVFGDNYQVKKPMKKNKTKKS